MLDLAWLIPIIPYAAFAVLIFFGSALRHRLGERVGWIGVAGIAATIPLTVGCLVELLMGVAPVDHTVVWASLGNKAMQVGYAVDPLAAIMLVMVSIVATCIQVYSLGYMHGDSRFQRFFAYLSLFCGSMYLIVLANNFVMLYAGWEMVGLCSYLLIGFWYERKSAYNAAKKAFITTRVGDVGFAIGILILFAHVPELHFGAVFHAISAGAIPATVAGAAALFLFCGAIGKSAQFPLHTWLPDAMEGPTPVSALIHAATMVAAGVYMVGRLFTIFYVPGLEGAGPVGGGLLLTPLTWVAIIGLITALLAATIGVVQSDIKRVLAYSTISQLGYMMVAMGMGPIGMVAGIFHLITHAFFKALLFLGSGSVIHACHEEQDMWKMGGLARKAPVTYWTFWAGTLALAGIFPFAGFFSKDEILTAAFHNTAEHWVYWVFFVGLEIAAFMTAFYMGRACFLTFSGEPRSEKAEHAHESPNVMTVPLVILAVFAVLLGWIGSPWVGGNLFAGFLHSGAALAGGTPALGGEHGFSWLVAGISTLMALGGLLVSAAIYRYGVLNVNWIKIPAYPLYFAARHKFWFDDVYEGVLVRGVLLVAALFRWLDQNIVDGAVNLVGWGTRTLVALVAGWVDKWIVDGAVNLVGWMTKTVGEYGARLQTGRVQEYVSGFVFIACAVAAAAYVLILAMPYLEPVLRGWFGGS
ncbi:NADH-quinone oxidoreductase subunit L [bacterium]|nr:NADH-quinone oxidoreductase subunit L [bacterium]